MLVMNERKKLKWEKSQDTKIIRLCLLLVELKRREKRKPRSIWISETFKEVNRLAQGASDIY